MEKSEIRKDLRKNKAGFWSGGLLLVLTVAMILPLVLSSNYNPQSFSVNGRLTDSSGNSLTGNYVMNFSIYNNLTGGFK